MICKLMLVICVVIAFSFTSSSCIASSGTVSEKRKPTPPTEEVLVQLYKIHKPEGVEANCQEFCTTHDYLGCSQAFAGYAHKSGDTRVKPQSCQDSEKGALDCFCIKRYPHK